MPKKILIDFNGKVAKLTEHCKDLGITLNSIYIRHSRTGDSYEECLKYYQENDVNLHSPVIEFNGKIASLSEHCKDLGLNYSTVRSRHYRTGESYEKCLEYYQENGSYNYVQCKRFSLLINFNGKVASIAEHCRDLGIDPNVLWARKHRTGESDLECLEYFQKNGVKHIIRHKYRVKDKRLYSKWLSIKARCENPEHLAYKNYGKKGIKLCDRWQVYENFENDLLDSFLEHVEEYGIKETTIDRINSDGDYEPNNVRWATQKEQQNNRTNNIMITEDLTVSQFAEKYNLCPSVVFKRLKLGWSLEKIINTPVKSNYKYYLPCGRLLRHHCKKYNYNFDRVVYYIKKYNLEPHEALAKYLENKNNENNP